MVKMSNYYVDTRINIIDAVNIFTTVPIFGNYIALI